MTISEYKNQLESYPGKTQTPADFDMIWNQRKNTAKGILAIEPMDFYNEVAAYEKMTVAVGEHKVHARCIRPADLKKHPLVLMFHDLNRSIRGWHHMTRFIAQGYAVIALEAGAEKKDWQSEPENIDFVGRYCDALTLMNTALSLPFVDPERIVTWGEGFGAGLAMAVSAMLPGKAKCAALNPMPADFRGLCKNVSEEQLEKLDYVDVANFAPLLKGSVLMGICLMDEVAPPEGQYAAYNRVTCSKSLKVYPKYSHERVNFFENEVLKFLHD